MNKNDQLAEALRQRDELTVRLNELKEEQVRVAGLIATLNQGVTDDLADPTAPLIDLTERYAERYRLESGGKQIAAAISKIGAKLQDLNSLIANIEGTALRERQTAGRAAFEKHFPKLQRALVEAYPDYCASMAGSNPNPWHFFNTLLAAELIIINPETGELIR